jgi:protein involved in polysaccharide export with SLBB domain
MRYLTLVFALLALGTPLGAAADTPAGSAPPASYRFVPGDVIDITVPTHMGYDRTLTIQPDGRIQVPSVGEIVATGLTSAELAARIQQGLNAELVDPQVTVSLKEINKGLLRRVSILGAVKSPGVFELKEQSTLAEMLATAGGPTPVADLRRVTITRAGTGQKVTTDLSGAAKTGAESARVALEPGDQILVPEGASPTVVVLGEVVKPGSYELEGETRLLNALSLAGGPTPAADLHRVILTRAGQTTKEVIDLQELLTRGNQDSAAANLVLHPGDTLVLTASEQKYYVLGEVNKAEAYPLKPSDHLLDAITTAGGTTHEADLAQVVLIRKDPKGQAVSQRIDLKQMMKHGNMVRNEPMQSGDVVFVPNRKQKQPLSGLLGLLYPLGGLVNALR